MKKSIKFISLLFSLVFLTACSEGEVPALLDPVGMDWDTTVVKKETIAIQSTYSSQTVPYVEELFFETSGIIYQSNVMVGDNVKKGDILYELDVTDLKEQIENLKEQIETTNIQNNYNKRKLEIDVEIAQLNFDELERIAEIEAKPLEPSTSTPTVKPTPSVTETELVVSKSKLDSAKLILEQEIQSQNLSVSQMKSKLQSLENSLIEPKLIAPFDGQVVFARHLIIGDYVEELSPVVAIADMSKISLSGEYISSRNIETAQKVSAVIDGVEYEIINTEVPMDELISLQLSGKEVYTLFDFVEEPTGLEIGQFATIEVYARISENAITVPYDAVGYSQSIGDFVFLVIDDELVRQPVETGLKNDAKIEITEGLSEGDVVYVQR